MRRRADRVRPKAGRAGTSVLGLCCKMGICDVAFYNWRKKYGGLGPSELRRLERLKDENGKLKRLVAGDAPGCALKRKSEALPETHAGGQAHGLDFHQGGVLKRARLREQCARAVRVRDEQLLLRDAAALQLQLHPLHACQ